MPLTEEMMREAREALARHRERLERVERRKIPMGMIIDDGLNRHDAKNTDLRILSNVGSSDADDPIL